MCRLASVSKSGYYQWLKGANTLPKDHDDYLAVKEMFERGKSKWGWRTLQMKLKSIKNITMNHKKIKRIQNKYGLFTKIRQRNPYKAMMQKTQEHRMFENVLDRNFNQQIPGKVFCTDITYLFFSNRVAYFSAVKDIASGEIVAWNATMHITMDLVLATISQMKHCQNALVHSDQGFHYTNPEYIALIDELHMVQSMSRKGNCIDNSPMETFFGHFKDEVDYKNCRTFEELFAMVKEYVDYYNTGRQQWELKKMTPVQYRDHLLSVPI